MATSDTLKQFEGQKYLSLESYRRSGEGVATPVWFAQVGSRFYIYTLEDAFKVKRIRNNPRVRIAPCDIRGRISGQWVPASARVVAGEEDSNGHALLDRKYGWAKKIGNLFRRFRKRKRVVIAVDAEG
jgi:hypothetical protein